MRRTRLILAGTAILVLALPAAAAATVNLSALDQTAYPTIRASVVSDTGTPRAPAITENGVPVSDLQAQNLGRSKAIAMLVDHSQSMRGTPLADAKSAARTFVQSKQSSDEIAVIAIGSRSATLSPFSTAAADSDTALAHLKTDSVKGTALYDSIASAAQQLQGNPLPGRVIIVLTDGADNASKTSLKEAVAAARKANVAIYAIGIEGQGFTSDPLVQLSTSTGGQYFSASSTSALRGVYATIADTLRRTWRIQYVTSARPGDEIKVDASVVGQGSSAQSLKIGGTAASPPSSLLPKGFFGPGGPFAIALAVAVLVLFAALFFLAGIRGSWVRNRISAHVGETKGSQQGAAQAAPHRGSDPAVRGHRECPRQPQAVALDRPHARARRCSAQDGRVLLDLCGSGPGNGDRRVRARRLADVRSRPGRHRGRDSVRVGLVQDEEAHEGIRGPAPRLPHHDRGLAEGRTLVQAGPEARSWRRGSRRRARRSSAS